MQPVSTADTVEAVQQKGGHSAAYAWYVTFVLMLCSALNFFDAKLPFILIEAIKADLDLTDTQIGLITGPAFSLTLAIFAIPVARLSDRYSRKHIMAIAIAVWSAATAAGGASRSFVHFLLSRTGVAVGESACTPAAHSFIADYFPSHSRARPIAIYYLGAGVGGGLGIGLGGLFNDMFGWRTTMVLVGVLGIGLMALVLLTVKEPYRAHVAEKKPSPPLLKVLRGFYADPVVRHMAIGGTLVLGSLGGAANWLPAYAMRSFDLTATEVGASYGVLIGVLGILAPLVAGFASDWLSKRDQRFGLLLLTPAFAVAGLATFAALLSPTYTLFLTFFAFTMFLGAFYASPIYAVLQSRVSPDVRSTASATFLFLFNGIGLGSGAFFIGVMSDFFQPRFGEGSLRAAILLTPILALWAAVHLALAARAMTSKPLA